MEYYKRKTQTELRKTKGPIKGVRKDFSRLKQEQANRDNGKMFGQVLEQRIAETAAKKTTRAQQVLEYKTERARLSGRNARQEAGVKDAQDGRKCCSATDRDGEGNWFS